MGSRVAPFAEHKMRQVTLRRISGDLAEARRSAKLNPCRVAAEKRALRRASRRNANAAKDAP